MKKEMPFWKLCVLALAVGCLLALLIKFGAVRFDAHSFKPNDHTPTQVAEARP